MLAYAVIGLLSTLTVVIPDKYAAPLYVFRWHWYYWVIGLLVLALVALFETAYRAYRPPLSTPVTSAQWKELASKFDEFIPSYVRAEFHSESIGWDGKPVGDEWNVRDEWNNQFAPRCQALCQIAGAMLLKSPHIAPRLSEKIKTRSNDVWRWLYFLAEKDGVMKITAESSSTVHGFKSKSQGGTIAELPAASSTACLECASKEI